MNDKNIGFTGTQSGMTQAQKNTVARLLECLPDMVRCFVHGDCRGADSEADDIARRASFAVILRPCTITQKRAHCEVRQGFDVLHDPKPPLDRNRDIVDSTCALIAAPKEMTETLRSGTWSTIRYCRRQGKPLYIVWPDGTVSEERI